MRRRGRYAPSTDHPPAELAWQEAGVCRSADPEMWFPTDTEMRTIRRAIRVCQGCPVRVECLEYAMARNEQFGIWGGLPADARQRLRRERRQAAAEQDVSA